MTDQLRWGIVGCGDVVEKKSGPSIRNADRSRIVAVMRRDLAKLTAFADANDVPFRTTDPAEVIEHPEVDIVYVATPPAAHGEYVAAAAVAGKHVLVEKPMGMSAAQDEAMIAACRDAGVELFVAYYRRFQPHVLKMKELIDAGRLGTLVHGQIDFAVSPLSDYDWGWRIQPAISGGGLFVDVVSHRLDLMVYLLGPAAKAVGTRSTFTPGGEVEDVASICVSFESGAQCVASGTFCAKRYADRFVITGTEGAIISDPLDGHGFVLTTAEGEEAFTFEPYPGPHLGLIRHIEAVLAGETDNASSGEDGMITDRILDEGLGRQG